MECGWCASIGFQTLFSSGCSRLVNYLGNVVGIYGFRFSIHCLPGVNPMMLIHEDKCVLFQPQGRLDLQGGLNLERQLARVSSDQPPIWVVDMAYIDFVDSAGLLSLVNALEVALRRRSRLILCGLCPSVRVVLEITRLDQVFEIVADRLELSAILHHGDRLAVSTEAAAA